MIMFRDLFRILPIAALVVAGNLFGATLQVFNANITGTVSWYKTNEYVLNGFVFVQTNEVLNIEAGTVVRGQPGGTGTNVAALLVARGGRIFAQGTVEEPIIFTSLNDDLSNPSDVSRDTRGLWGGVAILGTALINSSKNGAGSTASPQYDIFEGLPDLPDLHYGGGNDNDDSGVFRYVSIRHAGVVFDLNREMNGLTLCAVGSGTTVDHVEIFANNDDGVEFFGGTVNTRYMVAAFCDDDGFDTDQGYRGTNQFWFVIQAPLGNRNFGGEYAGDPVSPFNRLPLSSFAVFNATYIGAGITNITGVANHAIDCKEDTAARHYNTIFTDFADRGIRIQNSATNRLNAGDLDFRNNIWFGFRGGDTAANLNVLNAAVLFSDTSRSNLIVNPLLQGISRTNLNGLDPRPAAGSPALAGNHLPTPANPFLTPVNYVGAFGATELWTDDWTFLSQAGYTPPPTHICPQPTLTIVRNGANVDISFTTQAGCNYQLQSTDSLSTSPVNWGDDGSSLAGNGSGINISRAVSGSTIRVFRVITQ
jgi:hypothetical protein